MRLSVVVGARPNFVKVAALFNIINKEALASRKFEARLVHTGQHYDRSLSESFFEDLRIPEPDVNLNIGGGSSLEQIGRMLPALERDFRDYRPDFVIVVGDVNSTLAGAIAAKNLGLRLVHIEAGLRSFDTRMPEEINRMVTDSVSDIFFTTSRFANQNLLREGHSPEKIHFVGNTMIDTLKNNLERLRKPRIWSEAQLQPKKYGVLTLHRPSNVDDLNRFRELISVVQEATSGLPIVFPVHPRTKKQLMSFSSELPAKNFLLIDPLPYLEFNFLVKHSLAVLTDSGGIQEESTWMSIPCLTLRDSTERPETVEFGTNELLGVQLKGLGEKIKHILSSPKTGQIPELWDGNSSERILKRLLDIHESKTSNVRSERESEIRAS